MSHPDTLILLQALSDVWPELPGLAGAGWPQLQPGLTHLLERLRSERDPDQEALLRWQVLVQLRPYPVAWAHVQDRMNRLATRGEPAAKGVFEGYRWRLPGPPEATPPAAVTRYTDITCPRRVWVIYGRIAVTVGLTVLPSQFTATLRELSLQPSLPVRVRVAAPGFQVLGAREQETPIRPDADSPALVFYLQPQDVGHTEVSFDFSQGGNPLGTASVPVEITAYEVEPVAESRPAQAVAADPTVQPADRILYIRYERNAGQPALCFTLQRLGEIGQEFHPMPLDGSPEKHMERLYGSLDLLARNQPLPPADVDRQLRAIGRSLWSSLMPDELRSLYAAERSAWRDSALIVVSDEPYLPWELLWPYGHGWEDDEPWCLTLRLARWLRRNAQGSGNPGPPGRLHLQSLACLAPTDSDLAFVQKERALLAALAQQHGLADLSPDRPDWSTAMDLLEEGGYDWLHAATHGHFDAGAPDLGSAIRLQDRAVLTAEQLAGPEVERHLHDRRPGFFFNACTSGRQGWGLTRLGGWADRLISSGAGLFLAPQWKVDDESALAFAEAFYGHLLARETAAEAVRQARRAARLAGGSTWLAYSLYAHPNARVDAPQLL